MASKRINDFYGVEFFEKHYSAARATFMEEVGQTFHGYFEFWEVESPLEASFVVWWHALSLPVAFTGADKLPKWTAIVPQYRVEVDGAIYRLDFAIQSNAVPVDTLKIGVELDGHEFHERTKEQVRERDQRDRRLLADGWNVLHFSGSEFNADPRRCINEVVEATLARINAIRSARD